MDGLREKVCCFLSLVHCAEGRLMCLEVGNGMVHEFVVDGMGCLPRAAVEEFSLACGHLDSMAPVQCGWLVADQGCSK